MKLKNIILFFVIISSINIVFSATTTTTSGIKLIYETNISSTNYNYSTIYDLVKDTPSANTNPYLVNSNYITSQINYTLRNFSVRTLNSTSYPLSYNTNYKIYGIANDITPKCSITSNTQNCTFTASGNDFLENYMLYKFNVCNSMNGCYTIAKKFSLTQKNTARNIRSGINLVYTFNTSSTQKYSTIYDLVKDTSKSPLINYYNYSTKETKYILQDFLVSTINTSNYHLNYNATYKIYSITNDLSPKCSITIPYQNCTFTATSNDLLDNYMMYKFNVCNSMNGCYVLAKRFTIIQKDYAQKVISGINLFFTIIITEPVYPYYVSPTPNNNSNIISNQINFNINKGTQTYTWFNITINGNNYSLTDQGSGIWSYPFTPSTNEPTTYTFKIYYSGGELEQRTTTIYPDYTQNKLNAIGLLSWLIFILIIPFSMINLKPKNKSKTKKKDKKGIAPIVATMLLLIVTVTAFITIQNFYLSNQTSLQAKKLSINNNLNDMVEIVGIKYENSNYYLYVRSNYKTYIKIEKIILNNNECDISSGNVVLATTITKVPLDCSVSISQVNKITFQTREGIKSQNVRLSN